MEKNLAKNPGTPPEVETFKIFQILMTSREAERQKKSEHSRKALGLDRNLGRGVATKPLLSREFPCMQVVPKVEGVWRILFRRFVISD